MANGDQSGTWGTTNNTNLGTLIEQAISGYVTQAITDGSGANTTITIPNGATGVARNMFIEMTGALTFSTTSLIVPANKKMYFIYNNTTGGFAVTVKVSGQTGILVPNGKKVVLTSNGTDIVEAHTAIVGNATMGGTLGITGTTTAAAINASGTVAMAGAATVGTTLGVSGTSTMAAINASGNISINSGVILLTAATGAINTAGALTLAPASANPQITLTDVTKGSGYIQGGVNTGGTGAGDYWIFNVPTSRGLSWAVNNSTVLNAVAAGVSIPGTLSVTGTSTMAAINASGSVTLSGTSFFRSITTSNTPGTFNFYLAASGIREGTAGDFNIDTYNGGWGARLTISQAGAVTIPGTLGVGGAAVGFGNGYNEITIATGANGAMLYLQGTGPLNHRFYGNGAGVTYDASGATSHQFVNNGVNTLGISSAGAVTIPGTLGVTGITSLTGAVLINTASNPNAAKLRLAWTTSAYGIESAASADTLSYHLVMGGPTYPSAGAISTTNNATTYATSSDKRLKEDKGICTDISVLLNTEIHDFVWKGCGDVDRGVFAQDAILVNPRAVSHDVERDWWGADYSKYIPDLIVGWQNHEARLAALQEEFQSYKNSHP